MTKSKLIKRKKIAKSNLIFLITASLLILGVGIFAVWAKLTWNSFLFGIAAGMYLATTIVWRRRFFKYKKKLSRLTTNEQNPERSVATKMPKEQKLVNQK